MKGPIDDLFKAFVDLKLKYDLGENNLEEIAIFSANCLELLKRDATIVRQGATTLRDQQKEYDAYSLGDKRSRPIRRDLMTYEPDRFLSIWRDMVKGIERDNRRIAFDKVDAAVYTATQAFSCTVDVLRPGSRKTPGTHLEVLIGSLLGAVTGLKRGKQIKVPGEGYTVPTDIVLFPPEGDPTPVLVVPTKITTRERIVQPFAQQRILDEVYGRGKYRSILVMVSELQRDDEGARGLNEICVPNQVGMFQDYLAQLYGLYYADPPHAYATAKFTAKLPVRTIGELFSEDLPRLLTP